jgi:hypothetical protein
MEGYMTERAPDSPLIQALAEKIRARLGGGAPGE